MRAEKTQLTEFTVNLKELWGFSVKGKGLWDFFSSLLDFISSSEPEYNKKNIYKNMFNHKQYVIILSYLFGLSLTC